MSFYMRTLLCLTLLVTAVLADYGQEHGDLMSAPDFRHPETIEDDASVPADEKSIQQVDIERETLVSKLKDIEILKRKMESKRDLLEKVRQLQGTISDKSRAEEESRQEEINMKESYQLSIQRKNSTYDAKEHIAEQRRNVEKQIEELKTENETFGERLATVVNEQKRADARERELELERQRLLKNVEALASRFKEEGLQTWLERNMDTFPAVIRETILKSSVVLEPVMAGVDEAAELNEQLTHETTEAITRYLPAIKNSPFYTGLIFYIILLCPVVATSWLIMKIRARLSQLTIEHYLIALNLYFAILTVACAIMSALGKTDILIIFRHRSHQLAESFMIVHGFLFICHLVLHGMTAYVSGARKDFAQYLCMSCVGLHFFMNAYKRTILDQDPHIGTPAYIIYATIFLYTLYDRGVHIIEAAMRDRKGDPGAFNTYAEPSYKLQSNGSYQMNGDKTVYFAGLPIFSSPSQSSINDAKTI